MWWIMSIILLLWTPSSVPGVEFEAARHLLARTSFGGTLARRWWGITGDFLQGRNFPVLDCLA